MLVKTKSNSGLVRAVRAQEAEVPTLQDGAGGKWRVEEP